MEKNMEKGGGSSGEAPSPPHTTRI